MTQLVTPWSIFNDKTEIIIIHTYVFYECLSLIERLIKFGTVAFHTFKHHYFAFWLFLNFLCLGVASQQMELLKESLQGTAQLWVTVDVQIGAELADETLFTFAGGAVHDSMLLDRLFFID